MENPEIILSREIAITQTVIDDFITFSGDCNLLHTDDEWTARNSRFPRRIAHGAILNAFVSKYITEKFGPGTVYVEQMMQFKHPVYIGDKITIMLMNPSKIKKLTRFETNIVLTETEYHAEKGHTPGTLIATGHALIVEHVTPP